MIMLFYVIPKLLPPNRMNFTQMYKRIVKYFSFIKNRRSGIFFNEEPNFIINNER